VQGREKVEGQFDLSNCLEPLLGKFRQNIEKGSIEKNCVDQHKAKGTGS